MGWGIGDSTRVVGHITKNNATLYGTWINSRLRRSLDVSSSVVKLILRSDEEKKWCDVAERKRRKLVVKNFSETFVKNAFHLL